METSKNKKQTEKGMKKKKTQNIQELWDNCKKCSMPNGDTRRRKREKNKSNIIETILVDPPPQKK